MNRLLCRVPVIRKTVSKLKIRCFILCRHLFKRYRISGISGLVIRCDLNFSLKFLTDSNDSTAIGIYFCDSGSRIRTDRSFRICSWR